MKSLEKIEIIVKKFSVDTKPKRDELFINELLEIQAGSNKQKQLKLSQMLEKQKW
jgi:hypothetical protein